MPLSDTAIRKAKPADTALRLFDSGGLYLKLAPSGDKRRRQVNAQIRQAQDLIASTGS